eukprot:11337601-Karenia_brevis.AAC.1
MRSRGHTVYACCNVVPDSSYFASAEFYKDYFMTTEIQYVNAPAWHIVQDKVEINNNMGYRKEPSPE